jgi:hypothetical protein
MSEYKCQEEGMTNKRLKTAIHVLRGVLKDTKYPDMEAFDKFVEQLFWFDSALCEECNGQGKVRVWLAQDELGPPEECKYCKGSGRRKGFKSTFSFKIINNTNIQGF